MYYLTEFRKRKYKKQQQFYIIAGITLMIIGTFLN